MAKGNQKQKNTHTPTKSTDTGQKEIVIYVSSEKTKEEYENSYKKLKEYIVTNKEKIDSQLNAANEESEQIIARATEESERIKKKSAEEYEKIIDKARTEAANIVSKGETEANRLQKELETEKDTLHKEIADEKKKLNSERLAISDERCRLAEQIQDEFKAQIQSLNEEIESLTKAKDLAESQSKTDKQRLKASEASTELYAEKFTELSSTYIPREIHELELKESDSRYEQLKEEYDRISSEKNRLRDIVETFGEDPSKLIAENKQMDEEIESLKEKISALDREDIPKLHETSERFENLTLEYDKLRKEKLELQKENDLLFSNEQELACSKRFVKILELQIEELKKELDRSLSLYGSRANNVFSNLSLLDEIPVKKLNENKPADLKTLCLEFRSYLANHDPKNPLYYDEMTIRTFIAGFASPSRLMILEGLSGTGKSSLPRVFQDFIGAKTIFVPVQSSWKDRNDLLGFYNDFKKQYKETAFLKALYEGCKYDNRIYCIVLDEMNLSRIEYYFADLLSVMEDHNKSTRTIELIPDAENIKNEKGTLPKLAQDGSLLITDNIWFIGTANKDDSTFTITDKVYDRSVVINFDKRGKRGSYSAPGNSFHMNADSFIEMLDSAKLSKADYDRYDSMITNLDEMVGKFDITFGNRIKNQLDSFVPAYVECGGSVEEAVDIMFCRKILRKLDGLYDEETKKNLDSLKDSINRRYSGKMPLSIAQIKKMMDRI